MDTRDVLHYNFFFLLSIVSFFTLYFLILHNYFHLASAVNYTMGITFVSLYCFGSLEQECPN